MTTTAENYVGVLETVCSTAVEPHSGTVDHQGTFPDQAIEALKSAALLGAVSAPEVGGLGLGHRGAAAIVERVARDCGSTAMITAMHFSGTAVLEALAPEDIRRAAASGEHLSTLAFSESTSRSQFWAPTSTAERNNGSVILNAQKSWITSANHASGYVWSSRPVEAEGMSALWLVPADAHGLSVESPFNGLELQGNDSSPVSAANVSVEPAAMLGEDGAGVRRHAANRAADVLRLQCCLLSWIHAGRGGPYSSSRLWNALRAYRADAGGLRNHPRLHRPA